MKEISMKALVCNLIVQIKQQTLFIIMQQPHQHGPQCRHGHGQGHGHGGHGHGQNSMSAKQYFEKVALMRTKNPEFYWMEILTGNMFNKYCESKGWDFMRSLSCQVVTMVVAQAEMMFTCEWLPLAIRPFVSGMSYILFTGLFFPLIFLLFFNFNVVYGVASLDFTALHLFSYLAILFYVLVSIRTAGAVDVEQATRKSKEAIKKREYLQNPGLSCVQCKTLKTFRTFHCPICKVCITKFTRHSLAFGTCIGSANQLLAYGFFFCMTIAELLTIISFFNYTSYGLITNIMFYGLNVYLFWICFVETATLAVMNFCFGLTEHEVRTWMMNQYLMKVPERQFVNSIGKGLVNNLIESFYALLGISAYESEKIQQNHDPLQQEIPISGDQQFKKLQTGKTYLVNWNKAFFYLVPQIPSHPCRDTVISIMKRDQPRMMEMYRLQKKFKEEVIRETEGQGLNDFQIQQKIAVKMQQYMVRNAQNIMPQMNQPNPEQQKMIQLQMLTHMITQLQQKDPQTTTKLKELLESLKSNQASPVEVGIAMRQIQQDMMKKQMEAVMKQREEIEKNKNIQQEAKQRKNEDQEDQLKNQQVADEDL